MLWTINQWCKDKRNYFEMKLNSKRRYSSKTISANLLCLYSVFIALGVYFRINAIVMGIYFIITMAYFIRRPGKYIGKVIKGNNTIASIWLLLMISRLISVVINFRVSAIESVFIDFAHFFIMLVLISTCDECIYFKNQRNLCIILMVATLIDYALSLGVFTIIKSRAGKDAIDSVGGISGIYEYRHYFGLYLIFCFIILKYFPFGKVWQNTLSKMLLVLSIILTFTRNIWIAFTCILLFDGLKNIYKKQTKIKQKSVKIILISLFILFIIFIANYRKFLPIIQNVLDRLNMNYFKLSKGGVRGYTLRGGIKLFLNKWDGLFFFGGGHGYAKDWLRANPYGYSKWDKAIDIQYITSLLDNGIVGLALLALALAKGIKGYFSRKHFKTIQCEMIFVFAISLCFFDVIGTNASAYILLDLIMMMQYMNRNSKR